MNDSFISSGESHKESRNEREKAAMRKDKANAESGGSCLSKGSPTWHVRIAQQTSGTQVSLPNMEQYRGSSLGSSLLGERSRGTRSGGGMSRRIRCELADIK